MMIKRNSLLRYEQTAASPEVRLLTINPNVKVLFGFISLKRDMKALNHVSSLCGTVKQRAEIYLVFVTIESRSVWPEKHNVGLRHQKLTLAKKVSHAVIPDTDSARQEIPKLKQGDILNP